MLTLITGSLGTGKTALMVKLLTEHSSYPDNAVVVGVNRPDNRGGYLVKVKYPSMSYYPGFVGSFLQPELEEYTR
ncbi:GTP-binding protein [Nitrosomonas europaea]|uniref:GTP-binding protein n=1 Tax=Nitrosomonas europaea TaxID=915 RepID=UPI003BB7E398